VVTARGRAPVDVLIRAGRILALVPRGAGGPGPAAGTAAEPADGPVEIDATGLLVLPGFVDTHVHLMEPGDGSREDFPAGTSAALHQGVTTIVEHTHGWPVTTAGRLREKLAAVRGRSWVDFGLAAHVWPDHLDDLAALWHDGVSFFKIFTCDTHGIPGLGTDLLLDALGLLAGLGAPCLIHCEDGPITAAAQHRLQRLGRDDPWILPEWRSREAELVATTTACLLTRLTGARTTIAHASCAEVVEVVSAAAAAGADVVAESCPQYLLLAEAEVGEHAALRKFTPPARIRASRDGDRMWAALDGRVPLERVVEAYATAPARRYRLRGKGDLLPGCDGDLVLIDPGARWELGDSHVRSKAGWTPYAGRVVRGKVAGTILRGSLAAWQGEHTGEPGGRFVAGPGSPTGR
jgi:dihydroorotase-like cyclic amidohydrolase